MNKNSQNSTNFVDKAKLIFGMREAYAKGKNAMEYARYFLSDKKEDQIINQNLSTLIAYDLQSGNYVDKARKYKTYNKQWGELHANQIVKFLPPNGTLLEVGVGEATTMVSILKSLKIKPSRCLGFDISWSRLKVANQWIKENSQNAELFVGDMFNIPLANNSIDIVYSSHSLEPNAGYEETLLKECYRVARKAVILIEPIYELASNKAKKRMKEHGYISGLHNVAKNLGYKISNYKLLDIVEKYSNSLNPTGVLSIIKSDSEKILHNTENEKKKIDWQCPLTKSNLIKINDAFFSKDSGIAYPILDGIPLLRIEHGLIASLYQ